MDLLTLAQGFELRRALVKSRIVGGSAVGSGEGQVSEEDASQMAQFAVLREQ